MNKYIKINENNEIIDVFFEWQNNKFDGTEIFLEDTEILKHKINGKSISEELGCFIFTYDNGTITEKTQNEIETDPNFIAKYKKAKRDEIETKINNESITNGITKTIAQIKPRWASFKQDYETWATKAEIDTAYNDINAWLEE